MGYKWTKERAEKPIVVDHAFVENGIWTSVDSGGVEMWSDSECILTALADGLNVGYKRNLGWLLAVWPEQLDQHK